VRDDEAIGSPENALPVAVDARGRPDWRAMRERFGRSFVPLTPTAPAPAAPQKREGDGRTL